MDANAFTPQGFWYDTLDSTQEEAKRLLANGRIQGLGFVVADEQTHGKGSQGRIWQSPTQQGIYLSVVQQSVNPEHGFAMTPIYTLAAAVACVEAVLLVTEVPLRLKPINDLMGQISEGPENGTWAKCGGILVESQVHENRLNALITGIGINIEASPEGLDQPTTCLMHCRTTDGNVPPFCHIPENSRATIKDNLVDTLVGKLLFWHGLVQSGKTAQVLRAWQRHGLSLLSESCMTLLNG